MYVMPRLQADCYASMGRAGDASAYQLASELYKAVVITRPDDYDALYNWGLGLSLSPLSFLAHSFYS